MAAPNLADRVPVGDRHTAEVYAEALLRAADAAGELNEVTECFVGIIDELYEQQPDIEALLTNIVVPTHVKDQIIDKAFEGRCPKTLVSFLHVLNHHGRLNLLRSIRYQTARLLEQRANAVRVFVESAQPLTDGMREQIVQTLKTRMRRDPILTSTVNPDILGGFIVRVDDFRFDGSVRTQLESLRRHLIERSNHEIQSRRDRFCPRDGD